MARLVARDFGGSEENVEHVTQTLSKLSDAATTARRGALLVERGRMREAEKCFRDGLSKNPACAHCHYGLGYVRSLRGEYSRALRELWRSLFYGYDERPAAYSAIAYCHMAMGHRRRAVWAAKTALRLCPGHGSAQMILDEVKGRSTVGMQFLSDGAYHEAYPYLRWEARKERLPSLATFCRDVAAAVCTDDGHALDGMDPHNYRDVPLDACLRILGMAMYDLGMHEKGLAHLREAVDQGQSRESLEALAHRLRDASHHQEALAVYDRMLIEDANDSEALVGRANILLDLDRGGNLGEAEELLRKATEVSPGDPVPWNDLGLVLAEQGRFSEALACYEKAKAKGHWSPVSVCAAIGHCHLNLGRLDEAARATKEALCFDPSDEYAKGLLEAVSARLQRRGEQGDSE